MIYKLHRVAFYMIYIYIDLAGNVMSSRDGKIGKDLAVAVGRWAKK